MKSSRFKVYEFTNPSGQLVWRVSGTKRDGTRVRKNHRTEEEALDCRRRPNAEWDNVITSISLKYTSLSEDQIREAESVFDDLGDRSLKAAVRFYLENHQEPGLAKTVTDALAEFIEEKRQDNRRKDTIRNLKGRIGYLEKLCGQRLISEITEAQLRAVVHRAGRSPETKNNDRRAFANFFGWATEKKYCATNPMAGIKAVKFDKGDPEIFSLEQIEKLLSAATSHNEGALMPYVVLALFAAIRPRELSRLSWRDIDLEGKLVSIGSKAAKTRGKRYVELSENAIAWLAPYAVKQTPIVPSNWRKEFDAVKKAAGLTPWIQDGLRHTGVSHHLAFHGHEGETARWAGNSPSVIHRHYKEIVKKVDTAKFWNIFPDGTRVEKVNFGKAEVDSGAETA
jgi:integrase/recombinase XerD